MNIDKVNLECLWVETKDGERAPVSCVDGSCPPPETHPYAFSRFPCEVTTTMHVRRSDGAYGTDDRIASGASSYPEDLALALANGSNGQRQFRLSHAIIIASQTCERCMNALAHQYGLTWGYPEGSESWIKSNTKCDMCR